jgi:bile acid:Na+ symporter, BASS family
MEELEHIKLNFSEGSLIGLNVCLAFIMFSVALNLDWKSLRYTVSNPKGVIAGLLSQLVILPLITLLLIYLIKPTPSIAMGMILLAACPGGNVSNFFSMIARGNIALSVTLTTISSLTSAFTTPLIFVLLSKFIGREGAAAFDLPFGQTLLTIALVIVAPALLGMFVAQKRPLFASAMNKTFQRISMLILVAFIVIALQANFSHFINHIGYIFWIVLVHNLLAFTMGFITARGFRLPLQDRITVSLETGIQNTALGLVIVFNFFDGNGPMSFILAWWGVWHLLAGFGIGAFYRRFTTNLKAQS